MALILLAPLLLLIAFWIRVDSTGPVMFRQERVGQGGRLFRIHKFRTMYVGAEGTGLSITVGTDPRISKSGAVLRRYKLDELPQLIDVLLGDMSLVGPRPEVPKYVAYYPVSIRNLVLSVRPGITDNAAIHFFDEAALLAGSSDPERAYVELILPRKLEMYSQYVRNRTTIGDIIIILRTVMRILSRRSIR